MSIHRLPGPLLTQVRSTNFDGSVLSFPRIVRLGDGFAGTRAANISIGATGGNATPRNVVDHRNLAHEAPMWAMLITHSGEAAAEAWRAGFAFRDYSRPMIRWIPADTAVIRGRSYTLYSAEPEPDMPQVLVIHADDENVFRSIATNEGPMGHAKLHNELLRRGNRPISTDR